MAYKQTITERVKFVIRYLISQGIATSQEDLGKKVGVTSKSYLSQLVSSKQNNTEFINKLMNFDNSLNKDWLYDENIESPFIGGTETKVEEKEQSPEDRIAELEQTIELLKKDVKYYADIADSRLETIKVQSKLISQLEEQINSNRL